MFYLKGIFTGTLDLLMLMKYQEFVIKCYESAKQRVGKYNKCLRRVNEFYKLFSWF